MKRQGKLYKKPKRPFDKTRIERENKILKEFGLKNKKEIWKAEAKVKKMREKAKRLISADPEEQKTLFDRLNKLGFDVKSIGDILALEVEDYLERRLGTVIIRKKLVSSAKTARQLINHKKVLINGKVIDSPSYLVSKELENKISLKETKPKKKSKKETTEKTEEKPKQEDKDNKKEDSNEGEK
jgi:small subunit ribosomal protein S4